MKKFFATILVLFMALVLVACGENNENNNKDDKKDETVEIANAAAAKAVYDATVKEYSEAKSVNVKFSYNEGTKTDIVTFQYNLEGNTIKELAYVVKTGDTELSIYVKDGVAYMNAYGTKTKVTLTDDDNAEFVEKYTVAAALKEANNLFGYTFFTVATLESAKDGVCKLSCDLTGLEADPELDEDAYFDMEENLEKLQENNKALEVEFNYANGKVTKFVGTATKNDDTKKVFTIEFNGTSAAITFPDFAGYEEAK